MLKKNNLVSHTFKIIDSSTFPLYQLLFMYEFPSIKKSEKRLHVDTAIFIDSEE